MPRFTSVVVRSQIQLAGTLLAMVTIRPTVLSLIVLLVWWTITFWPLRPREITIFFLACLFFTVMNFVTLHQGIFSFTEQDILGMPYFELGMWGFYLLHTLRTLRGTAPTLSLLPTLTLALLLAVTFSTVHGDTQLTLTSLAVICGGFVLYHERFDLLYAGYMIYLGAIIEYTGVSTGMWSYPAHPPGGVPLWFVTLWGGVGLILRRLVLPLAHT